MLALLPLVLVPLVLAGIVAGAFIIYRRIVKPNEVHIVQTNKKTLSYGKDKPNGNKYYEWPSWMPVIGVVKTVLPVSVFDLSLDSYEAYDVGKVPFVVDVVAFFKISDSNKAAERAESFSELLTQLKSIVQGAIRTVLASDDIDAIMLERSKFGEKFTREIEGQLPEWGVSSVKHIELMDIRDTGNSQVVHNIMEKKKSLIEMQSRREVAENRKKAQIAEINARKEADIEQQASEEAVGLRTAQKSEKVGIADQQARQRVLEENKSTKEREMEVVKVETVKQADIAREARIIKASEEKEALIITAEASQKERVIAAEAEKESKILIADGDLVDKEKEAVGIEAEGLARAKAEKEFQLASVQAQVTLAEKVGENKPYQDYLVRIKEVEANQVVGVEQAQALKAAEIKVIANTGQPVEGVNNVMDLFSSKGGTQIGAMLEAVAQTDAGQALVKKALSKKTGPSGKSVQ